MEDNFVRFNDESALNGLILRSQKEPVVIFKHSQTCPVSAQAYRQMSEFTGEVALIEIQDSPALSMEIENRTGVAHESPQVIVLRNGKAVWSASHWNVKAEAVSEAVKANE